MHSIHWQVYVLPLHLNTRKCLWQKKLYFRRNIHSIHWHAYVLPLHRNTRKCLTVTALPHNTLVGIIPCSHRHNQTPVYLALHLTTRAPCFPAANKQWGPYISGRVTAIRPNQCVTSEQLLSSKELRWVVRFCAQALWGLPTQLMRAYQTRQLRSHNDSCVCLPLLSEPSCN